MPDFKTDQALWYNSGIWGKLGYAVPNFGDDPTSLNSAIYYLTSVMGRNLSAVMQTADADLRTPPRINTLIRIHKLVVRARGILSGRAVPPGTPEFEATHSAPGHAGVPHFSGAVLQGPQPVHEGILRAGAQLDQRGLPAHR